MSREEKEPPPSENSKQTRAIGRQGAQGRAGQRGQITKDSVVQINDVEIYPKGLGEPLEYSTIFYTQDQGLWKMETCCSGQLGFSGFQKG